MKQVWPQTARALTARADSSPCLDRGMNVVVYVGGTESPQIGCFMGGQGAKARSIAFDGSTPTLRSAPSGGNTVPDVVYPIAFAWANSQSAGISFGETSPTIKAANGGCPATVYPINTMVATRGGKDDMRTCFGIGEPNDPQFTISAAHSHGVCYERQNDSE